MSYKPHSIPVPEELVLSDGRLRVESENEPVALGVHHLLAQADLWQLLDGADEGDITWK